MGPVRSRFFAHLPANTPVYPHKIARKSFLQRILPVSLTGSGFCAQNHIYLHENKDFQGGGGGGTQPTSSPKLETTRAKERKATGEERLPPLRLQWTPMIRNLI